MSPEIVISFISLGLTILLTVLQFGKKSGNFDSELKSINDELYTIDEWKEHQIQKDNDMSQRYMQRIELEPRLKAMEKTIDDLSLRLSRHLEKGGTNA